MCRHMLILGLTADCDVSLSGRLGKRTLGPTQALDRKSTAHAATRLPGKLPAEEESDLDHLSCGLLSSRKP